MKQIVCEEGDEDFDNCSYSVGTRSVKTYILMLFCKPQPGKSEICISLQLMVNYKTSLALIFGFIALSTALDQRSNSNVLWCRMWCR